MVCALRNGFRLGRVLTLVTGLSLFGGLLADSSARAQTAGKTTGVGGTIADVVPIIDKKLEDQWKENKITPSARCGDYEYIRRATLDILGRIAKPEEIKAFLAKPESTRRAWLIEELLKHEDYAKNWANIWTNWLLTRTRPFGRGIYRDQTQVWLEDQFAQNKKHHELVTELLTAKGKNSDNGAVNFILAHVGEVVPPGERQEKGQFEMVPITSRTTRLFLGIQTQCTQCHDHPFDARLKQNHFWGINAFFRQVERVGNPPNQMRDTPQPLELRENKQVNRDGFVFFEKRNGVVLQTKASFLDGTKVSGQSADRRAELAQLIVGHESFPKAFANRMWAHFFGRGFVQPIDDFNDQNQPSNPELLDELGAKFKHYGYDQKKLITWICNSKAYNLSSRANSTNDKQDAEPFFSRMLLKSMAPEQLFESLMIATMAEVGQNKDAKRDLRNRWMNALVANFGDDEGNEVNYNGTVVQALLLMNGNDINQAITDKNATVSRMMAAKLNPTTCVNTLYIAALNRPPTKNELTGVLRAAGLQDAQGKPKADKDPAAPWHDLIWALLNSNEFILNH